MNGHAIPDTPIAVDCWRLRNMPSARVFFLTHYHADHMVGLTADWHYPIHCSPVTGDLLVKHKGIQKDLVRTLEINDSHIVNITKDGEETISVSVFDANHIPGSVMFCFEGYFGKILYTGDFRYSKGDSMQNYLRHHCLEPDILYLDNTYCDPYCLFPTREKAKQKIFDILDCHKDFDIVLGMHAFGKEDLLCGIANRYNRSIAVGKTLHEKLQVLDLPDVFTNSPMETNFKVVNLHCISRQQVRDWNSIWPTVVLVITSLYSGTHINPYADIPKVFVIEYSNHSSYSELVDFVKLVKPKKIKPIVTGSKGPFGYDVTNRSSMCLFRRYMSKEPAALYTVPQPVLKFMKQSIEIERPRMNNLSKIVRGIKRKRVMSIPKGVVYDSPEKHEVVSSEDKNVHERMIPERSVTLQQNISPNISDPRSSTPSHVPYSDQACQVSPSVLDRPSRSIPNGEEISANLSLSKSLDKACQVSIIDCQFSIIDDHISDVENSDETVPSNLFNSTESDQGSRNESTGSSSSLCLSKLVPDMCSENSDRSRLFKNQKTLSPNSSLSVEKGSSSHKQEMVPKLESVFRVKKRRSKQERRKIFYSCLNQVFST